ncbi:MAG: DUF411 domain-containing protein [Vicinamibacterales bacterium]
MKASVLTLAAALGVAALSTAPAAQTAAQRARAAAPKPVMMAVYKTPTCGCCAKWVEHMKQNGFTVHVTDLNDLSSIKSKHGVPTGVQSCHTGIVNGYVVEGHVPAADVKRMLKERPAVAGLALPGMPAGSPGMEVPGRPAQPYDVLTFDKNGVTRVFAKH